LIFLVGAQRSGTNWLHRIIAAQPAVFGVPSETNLFALGVQPLIERFHQGSISSPQPGTIYMDRDALLDALRDFCDGVFARLRDPLAPQAGRILERTPDHVRVLGTIAAIYPDARFVHIIRDGRDVARSLLAQTWGPTTIADAAETWRSAVDAGLEASASLEHYIEVRYEELLERPREEIERVYRGLGLPADANDIDKALVESKIPYNVDPSAREIGVGKWKASFTTNDLATVERIAGPTLRRLGYEIATTSIAGSTPATAVPRWRRRRSRWIRRRRRRATVEATADVQTAAAAAHRFVTALHAGDRSTIEEILAPDAYVSGTANGNAVEGRGGDAREAFVGMLLADTAFRGTQIHGESHAGRTVHPIVASYRTERGIESRVLVLWFRGDRIARAVVYRFPLDR